MKAPQTKIQTPKNSQVPSSKAASLRPVLEFGAWDFSGAWCLGFGIWRANDDAPLITDNERLTTNHE